MTTMLKFPYETRFCTNFYTVQSLLKNKNVVLEIFVCASFCEWDAEQTEAKKAKITCLKVLIDDRHFWSNVGDYYLVM